MSFNPEIVAMLAYNRVKMAWLNIFGVKIIEIFRHAMFHSVGLLAS